MSKETKSSYIIFRVTPTEKAEYEAKAEKQDIDVSKVIRKELGLDE